MNNPDIRTALEHLLDLGDRLDNIGAGIQALTNSELTTRSVCKVQLGDFLLYLANSSDFINEGQAEILNLVLVDDDMELPVCKLEEMAKEACEPEISEIYTLNLFMKRDMAVSIQKGKSTSSFTKVLVSAYKLFGQLMLMMDDNVLAHSRYNSFISALETYASSSRVSSAESDISCAELDAKGKSIIGSKQFMANMTLKNIIIPEGITEIGDFAFNLCLKLESVIFPKSLRKVGNFAFMECRSLKRVEFQEGVRELGDHAFGACSALLRVDLPNSLENVSRTVFGVGGDSPYTTAYLSGETAKRLGNIYARQLVIDGKEYDSIHEYLGLDCLGNPMRKVHGSHSVEDEHSWMDKYGQYVTHNPQVQFEGKLFVFTGFGGKSDMDDPLVQAVLSHGGQHRKSISGKTDYLIVNPDGAGEAKLKQAVERIQNGGHIKIVLKTDIESALNSKQCSRSLSQQSQRTVKDIAPISKLICSSPNEYNIDSEGCLTAYYGNNSHLILPNGVKSIGSDAFQNSSTLVSIVIPEGVEVIEEDAFNSCTQLASVKFPDTLREIGKMAFYQCENLQEIVIPEGVNVIKQGTFNSCTQLSRIKLPDTLREISDEAFWNCAVQELVIPEGVETINDAFFNCEQLVRVKLPNTLRKMGAFFECKSLEEIIIPKGVEKIERHAFFNCEQLGSVKLPDTLGEIDSYAFCGCKNLREIVIPEGIETINDHTFFDCEQLTSIKLPDTLYKIANEAFSCCKNLQQIVIPRHVVTIEKSAFRGCEKLQDIYVPESVIHIGKDAFISDNSKKFIHTTMGSEADNYAKKHQINVDYTYTAESESRCEKTEQKPVPVNLDDCDIVDNCLVKYHGSEPHLILPDGIKSIGSDAFALNKDLVSIVIPNGVETLGDSSFGGCKSLINVVLPKTLRTIGEAAFYKCSIQDIIVPEGMLTIGRRAFEYCEQLINVTLPNTLRVIGHGAFNSCISLQNVILPKGIRSIEGYAFCKCELLRSLVLPDTIREIGSFAFYNCKNLQEIDIPEGVVTLEDNAFSGCEQLTSVKLPTTLKKIESEVFRWCEDLKEIIIPEGVVTIEDYAFAESGLTKVKLPDTLRKIGESAFSATNLHDIYIPESVVEIEDDAFHDGLCGNGVGLLIHAVLDSAADNYAKENYIAVEYDYADAPENNVSSTETTNKEIEVRNDDNNTPIFVAQTSNQSAQQEMNKAEVELKATRDRIQYLERAIRDLENERDHLRGLFKGGKRKKIQAQIDELQSELNTLRR